MSSSGRQQLDFDGRMDGKLFRCALDFVTHLCVCNFCTTCWVYSSLVKGCWCESNGEIGSNMLIDLPAVDSAMYGTLAPICYLDMVAPLQAKCQDVKCKYLSMCRKSSM